MKLAQSKRDQYYGEHDNQHGSYGVDVRRQPALLFRSPELRKEGGSVAACQGRWALARQSSGFAIQAQRAAFRDGESAGFAFSDLVEFRRPNRLRLIGLEDGGFCGRG